MSKTIHIGKDQVSLMNPPTEGFVCDKDGRQWRIGRTGNGNIMLRPDFSGYQAHPEFLPDGMSIQRFCQWINDQF